jgi:phosphoribosylanthranilate isomerase
LRTRVKICCIASPEEARLAIAAGADALGLVGAMPSGPGVIRDAEISAISRLVPPPVASFLLSSETDARSLARHAILAGVSALQIVDLIPPETRAAVRRAAPALKLVQVVHVEDETALGTARHAAQESDALLLDSGRPRAALRELGGTGRCHDWAISRAIVEAVSIPVFLAGGLSATNVREAIGMVRPFGVDLCTGVRTAGRLDRARLDSFLQAVRDA